MKKSFLFLLALLSFHCNRHSANKNFDLKINVDIGNYKYTCHPVTEAEFHALKVGIAQTWPQQLVHTRNITKTDEQEAADMPASRYPIDEYIRIANDMETFKKELTAPGEYLKTTAASPEIAVLEYNKVFAALSDECIAEPVNYSDLITTAMQGIMADNNIKLEICYGFKQLSPQETKYTIYAKLDHTLHTVTFSNTLGCTPDNTAIYLLLNKVLMSTDIKERLVRYSDHNSLVFVQPARYERLTRRLAHP